MLSVFHRIWHTSTSKCLVLFSVTLASLLLLSWRHERHNESRQLYEIQTLSTSVNLIDKGANKLTIYQNDNGTVTFHFTIILKNVSFITRLVFWTSFFPPTAVVLRHFSHWRSSMVIFSCWFLNSTRFVCLIYEIKKKLRFQFFHKFWCRVKTTFTTLRRFRQFSFTDVITISVKVNYNLTKCYFHVCALRQLLHLIWSQKYENTKLVLLWRKILSRSLLTISVFYSLYLH